MPELSRFYGIVVYMYPNDHAPPHFHAEYEGGEAVIDIRTLEVLWGRLRRRALALVLEWAALHRTELARNWERARAGRDLERIAPLK
jgi:Domain of unknown function (DUF4160)